MELRRNLNVDMLTLPLDLSHGPLLFGDKTGDESWIIGQKGNPCVKGVCESVGRREAENENSAGQTVSPL